MQVNVHEAKTQFSKLIRRVEGGERIVIAKDGKPVAVLTPVLGDQPQPRTFGTARGAFSIPEDFDAALPEEILASFE